MKQKDILTLVVVAIISAVISIFLSGSIISSESDKTVEVEVVELITSDLQRPPIEYFNENSINPTQLIQIGPNEGTEPFSAN